MTMPTDWYLLPFAALLSLLLVVWAVKSVRARRRRSLANIYGAGFYLSIKQPRPNYRIERM